MQGASRRLPGKKSDVLTHQTATINAERIQLCAPPSLVQFYRNFFPTLRNFLTFFGG